MKELLENYETRITSPQSTNRMVNFKGGDEEFSKWGFSGQSVYFKIKDSGQELKLTWNGNNFEGRDPRGGFSILRVDQTKLREFRSLMKSPTSLGNPVKKEIQKNKNFAVISKFDQSDGDHYYPDQDLKKQVNKLFESEYDRVYLLDFSPPKSYFSASNNACDTLNCHFVNASGIKTSDSPLDMHQCLNLDNFMLPVSTWARIKGKVMKSKKNFNSACSDAVRSMDLKIYAFSKSRVKNSVPNDNKLKNFRIQNAKTKSK